MSVHGHVRCNLCGYTSTDINMFVQTVLIMNYEDYPEDDVTIHLCLSCIHGLLREIKRTPIIESFNDGR